MAQDYWGNEIEEQGGTVPPPPQPPAPAQEGNTFLNNVLDKSSEQGAPPAAPVDSANPPEAFTKLNPLPGTAESRQTGLPSSLPPNGGETPAPEATATSPGAPTPIEPSPSPTETTPETVTEPTSEESLTPPADSVQPEERKHTSKWLPLVALLIIAIGAGVYFLFFNKGNSTPKTGVFESATSTITAGNEDSVRVADLDKIQKALEQYYLANNKYPESKDLTRTQDKNCPLNSLVAQYLDKLPVDPSGTDSYYGYKSENGSGYELSAMFNDAPEGVKSVETAKGFLVTLNPATTLSSQ